jgi:hypothetical protein
MKIIINWFLFLSFVGAIIVLKWHRQYIGQYLPSLPERGTMTGAQVVVFSLAIAFTWVEVLKWWKNVRPFNCLKCMTGWVSLILAFAFHVQFWWAYMFVGIFVGAVFGAIKMRYL